MNIQFKAHTLWPNAVRQNHSVNLDLDLAVSNFIRTKNVAVELATREQEFRKELHELIAAEIIPQIIAQTGITDVLPDGPLFTQCNVHTESCRNVEEPQRLNESLTVRSKLHMVLNLASNRPVHAMQALYNSRGGVADNIADDIIGALKYTYLGITSSKTQTNFRFSGNEVTEFNARAKTDFQGN